MDYDDVVTQLMYQVAKDTHDALAHFNIPYEIISGTLLGAVRHGGLIPHDDDVDIEVMKTYLPRLKSHVFPLLKKLGYRVDKVFFGYKISDKDAFPVKGYPWKFPFVDLFLAEVKHGRTWFSETDEFNDKEYFEEMFLKPRRSYTFGPLQLLGPANPIPSLNRTFGPDWSSTWYKQYDHAHEKAIKPKKVKMKPIDYKPRLPMFPLTTRIRNGRRSSK